MINDIVFLGVVFGKPQVGNLAIMIYICNVHMYS
jgi:hypothetical protein